MVLRRAAGRCRAAGEQRAAAGGIRGGSQRHVSRRPEEGRSPVGTRPPQDGKEAGVGKGKGGATLGAAKRTPRVAPKPPLGEAKRKEMTIKKTSYAIMHH